MNIFKISQPGNDVKDSKLADDVINSQYSNLKVDTTANPPHVGIIDVNWATSGIVIQPTQTKLLYRFNHNDNHIPIVFGNFTFDNGTIKTRGVLPLQVGGIGMMLLDSDDTYVNLWWLSIDISGVTPIPPFSAQIRYYVLAERGYE